jgi:Fur family ferric uptake transcriptional regulator
MKRERAVDTELRNQLRTAGLRVTAPRLAVLACLAGHPHTTADQVAAAVRDSLGSVSTQAVYDVLNAFTKAKLVRRIEPAGHPARFETRAGDNHHHLVCRVCGRTEDVDCTIGLAPCLQPADAAGYMIDEAEVVFWGRCPDCGTATAALPDSEVDNVIGES